MRILDEDNDKALKNLMILLTIEEAAELRDDLERMLQKNDSNEHTHINDMEFNHEITVVVYNNRKIDCFNERTKRLILNDE